MSCRPAKPISDSAHTAETLRQIAATLDHLRCMPTWQRVLLRAATTIEAAEARIADLEAKAEERLA